MEVSIYNTKGVMIMYPLPLFAIMLILLNGYCYGAAILVESNTTFRCDGRLDECLLEDDLQLEFLMNPFVSRLLVHGDPGDTGDTNDPDKVVFSDCGSQPENAGPDRVSYDSCVSIVRKGFHACKKRSGYDRCNK